MINQDVKQQLITALGEYNMASALLRNITRQKLDLNIADMECLDLLLTKGASTPTELARYTGLTTGSTTAMLDRLEKAKLITRKSNPKDRRSTLIEANQNFGNIIRPMLTDIRKEQDKLIASYTNKELEIIAGFLQRFANNVKEYTNSQKAVYNERP